MLSQYTIKKIAKNVAFLQSIRPVRHHNIEKRLMPLLKKYASREIRNIKTVVNFVLKLGSKRPEVSAKKFNDYIKANEVKVTKRSALDAGLEFEPVAITTKRNTLRSTPQQKPLIEKLIPKKLSNLFIRANIRYTRTYERTNKKRKTKLIHT